MSGVVFMSIRLVLLLVQTVIKSAVVGVVGRTEAKMKKFKCPCGGTMKKFHQESGREFIVRFRCTKEGCELLGTLKGKSKADVNRQIRIILEAHKRITKESGAKPEVEGKTNEMPNQREIIK